MKALNVRNMRNTRQSGFTIIELVVVILLLGILTATALPRFLDVTDEAHAAVVEALTGGLVTGGALFHAQWTAEGSQIGVAIAEFGSMEANSVGYPIGVDADADDTLSDNTECVEIYNNLLQSGRPLAVEDTGESTASAIDQANLTVAANAGAEVLAQFTAANVCTYAYIGQFSVLATADIPVLEFTLATASAGNVVRGTDL